MHLKKILPSVFICIAAAVQAQNTFKVTAGTTLTLTGGVVITLDDMNLDNDGNISLTAGNGAFRFSGNSTTNISGTNQPVFDIMEIVKTGGAGLTLQRHIGVASAINFTSGSFNLNNNNIFLQPAALLIGEGETSRITGTNGGYVEIINIMNAPSSQNPGNLGAILTSAANLGSTTIRRGHQSQINAYGQGNSIFRYYDIIPANNNALNATLRFHYFDAELNALPEPILTQWKSINNTTWTDEGFTSRDQTNNYVEKTGIMDFSRWTLSSSGNPLPVTGLELQGEWHNNTARLRWKTITEINNHHFNIQRYYQNGLQQSTDIAIEPTRHIGGNSSAVTWYDYTDAAVQVTQGFIFYRIQQVDINGRFSFSNTIRISPGGVVLFIDKVYPTIVQNNLYIQTGNAPVEKMTITLHDMNGRLIMRKQVTFQSQQLELPVMSNGAYMLKIQSGEWEFKGTILKQ